MTLNPKSGGKVAPARPSDPSVNPSDDYAPLRRRGMLFLLLLVVAAMFAASWLAREDPQWRAAVDWARARERQWSQDGCPVVSAPILPGNAHDDFEQALRAVAAWPEELRRALEQPNQPGSALSAEHVAAAADAVAALRSAAHRSENFAIGSRRVGPDSNPLGDVASLREAFSALCGTACARAEAEPHAALAILLDGLVAAADLATAGIGIERLLGAQLLQQVTNAIEDRLLRAAEPLALEHLDTVLGRILGCWPLHGDWIERELAHSILFLEEAETVRADDIGVRSLWQTWSSGFSPRRFGKQVAASRLQQWRHIAPTLRLPDTTKADGRTMVVGLTASFQRQHAGALDQVNLVEILYIHDKASTALHLLRAAVHFHQGRPIDEPDPCGDGPLQVVTDGQRANLLSVEPDLRRFCERQR